MASMDLPQVRDISAAPATRVNQSPISAVGSVATGQSAPNGMPFPEYITFTLDNSAGTVAKTYILFDAIGAVAGTSYVSGSAPDGGSVAHGVVKASINAQPLVVKGYQYRVTTGTSAQFSQRFEICKATIGGAFAAQKLYPDQGIRNTALNEKVLTYDQLFTVDQLTAVVVTVQAATAVSLGLFIGAQFNAIG